MVVMSKLSVHCWYMYVAIDITP
uniref:Uncharacterized protein n=1 Tax=Arundo donax TaxID=35708 RepID=A0A0A8Z952_ARUDO